MASSITSSNAVLMLSIQNLFDDAQRIQGFSADDVFDLPNIKPTEAIMGVDGNLSGGKVNVPIVQSITLQADSDSNQIFSDWYAAQQADGDVYFADMIVSLPSLGKSYACKNGLLTDFSPGASAKKTLQPRKFEITWESIEETTD